MNRAIRMVHIAYLEKTLEEYIMDEEREPLEAMKLVWGTLDTSELRDNVYGSHLRPGIKRLCLSALDVLDVRKVLPKNGPYRSS